MNSYVVNRYNKPTPGATSQVIQIPHTGAGTDDTYQFGAFDSKTRVIYLSLTDGGMIMTIDGTTPTNTNSHRLFAGNSYYFNVDLVKEAKFKKVAGNTATAILYGSELTN